MRASGTSDYFVRARRVAAAGLVVAAVIAAVGATLPWARATGTPTLVPGTDFGNDGAIEPPRASVSGLEAGDGWWIVTGAIVLMISATLLLLWARGAGWGLLASVLIGGIAIADYRGIEQLAQDERVAGTEIGAGVGLTLVIGAAFLGTITAVAGMAASPRAAD